MFQELVNGLNALGGGVRAYETCARAARARIAAEPENAAALLLISYAAQLFVESYDDQPLTVEVASDEFARFSALVDTLDSAKKQGSATAILDATNRVALQIANQIASGSRS